MSDDWITTTIGEQVVLQRGFDITRAEQQHGRVPVVSSSGTSSFHNECRAKGPGVVLGRKGVVGSVWFVEQDYWPHDTTLWVRDFKGNDPRFVYYFFKSIAASLASLDVGSANPTLNRNHVHPMVVQWPPLSDQRAIAADLGRLDSKLELNRTMNRTLEQIAQAIFKAWFVDFEPVRAKAAGAPSFPGMPQDVFESLPSKLDAGIRGLVPQGWKFRALPEVIEVNPTRPLKRGVLAPYLDMKNMPTQGHGPLKWCWREFTSGTRFVNGDTLVARITPCLENGKTAFVDFLDKEQIGWGSTEFIILHPRDHLPKIYAYCLARSASFRDYAIKSMTGTSGRQRVPSSALNHYLVHEPPPAIARAFGDTVEPIFQLIRANLDEACTLAQARDVRLRSLFVGTLHDSSMDRGQETL